MSSCSELRKVQFSRIGTSEPWSRRFIRLGPIERKVAYRMSGSFIGLRSSWRRARKQLGETLPILKARVVLAKANENLKTAQAELQRRWQYLAEAQRLSHAGTFGWKVDSGEVDWSDETYRILGFARETSPTLDLVFKRVPPEDRDLLQELKDSATQNGMDLDIEHRI